MKKSILLGILFSGCVASAFAQSDATAPQKKEKMFDHYFGVQLNDLLRQIISFNNSTAAANNNPFLFTYNLNSRKSGWGIRAGVGATISSSTTNDNVTKRTTDIKDLQFRLGVEKRYELSPRWSTGIGVDGIVKVNNDHTVAVTNSTFEFTTDTKSDLTSIGGGVMGWLRYHITDRVLIGTETSFYFTSGKNKQTIITSDNSPQQSQTITNTNDTQADGHIAVPVTFYITVKI